jgi:predicted dehydrogenase
MLNVGIIGMGFNGSLHFTNCFKIKGINVLAVADKSNSARKRAQKYGVKNIYDDYNKLLEERKDLDCVIISLPNFLHYDCVIKSLEEGNNVFVEKPLANTVEQCKSIKSKVEQTGLKLMIGHAMRYYDAIQKMKAKVDNGEIGDLEFFTSESIMNGPLAHGTVPRPVPDWWFQPDLVGGGVLLDLGYHLIDLYHYFMGESKLVFANFDYKYNLEVEDTAVILLQNDKKENVNGYINVGWYQKSIFPKYDYRCVVHGDAGHLSTDDYMPKNMYFYAMKEGMKNFLKRITGGKINVLSYTYFYESFYKELTHFFDSVSNDIETDVTVDDGIRTMKIIEDSYKKYGRKII